MAFTVLSYPSLASDLTVERPGVMSCQVSLTYQSDNLAEKRFREECPDPTERMCPFDDGIYEVSGPFLESKLLGEWGDGKWRSYGAETEFLRNSGPEVANFRLSMIYFLNDYEPRNPSEPLKVQIRLDHVYYNAPYFTFTLPGGTYLPSAGDYGPEVSFHPGDKFQVGIHSPVLDKLPVIQPNGNDRLIRVAASCQRRME